MNQDVTPADREFVNRLYLAVDGLPEKLRARHFHDLHNQVENRVKHLRTPHVGYEEALQQAVDETLSDPLKFKWRHWWIDRHEIAREASRAAHTDLRNLWFRVTCCAVPERYPEPIFCKKNAVKHNPQLLTLLQDRYGERVVSRLCWPSGFGRPDEFLGFVESEAGPIFAVALEPMTALGPNCQLKLRQFGRLLNPLLYDRVVSFYRIDLEYCEVRSVGSHKIYWNDFEAVLFPVGYERISLREQDLLTPELEQLSARWLESQAISHFVFLGSEDLDYRSSLRAASPPEFWPYLDCLPDPGRLRELPQPAVIKLFGRTFDWPYLNKDEISWVLASFLLLLLLGFNVFTPSPPPDPTHSVALTDYPPNPFVESLKDPKPAEPLHLRDYLTLAGALGMVLGFFLAAIAGIIAAVKGLSHLLYTRTPLGTPKEDRKIIYVSPD